VIESTTIMIYMRTSGPTHSAPTTASRTGGAPRVIDASSARWRPSVVDRCRVIMFDGTQLQAKLVGSEEQRAVSPVIGVILMVAITVILAAVIAAFVLDLGPGDAAPQAQVSFSENSEYDDSEIGEPIGNFSHDGGDAWETDDVTVIVDVEDDQAELTSAGDFTDDFTGSDEVRIVDFDDENTFEVGDSATFSTVNAGSIDAGEDYELTVIHEPSDSIIFEFEGTTPDN